MASSKKPTKKVSAKKPLKKGGAAKPVAVAKVKAAAKPVAVQPNSSKFEIEEEGAYWPNTNMRSAGISQYPFASLKPGQTFFISAAVDTKNIVSADEAQKVQKEELARVANRMSGAVRRYTKHNEGVKFSVKMLNDPKKGYGVRVKRTA